MKHQLLAAYLLGPALLLSPGAFAGDNHEDAAIIQLIAQKAQFAPEQALAKVTKDYPGVVYEYELDDEDNQIVYEFKLMDLTDNKKYKVKLSAINGALVSEKTSSISTWFQDKQDIRAMEQAKSNNFSLLDAVKLVKEKEEGFLVKAELENEKGINIYKLEFATPNGTRKWLIDVDNQDIVPVYRN